MDRTKPQTRRRRTGRSGPGVKRSNARGQRRGTHGRPQQQQQGGPQSPRSTPRGQLPADIVYGFNPVTVALNSEHLKVLYFDKSRQGEKYQLLHAQAKDQGVEIQPLQRQGWAKVLPAESHQGIAGRLHGMPQVFIEEIVEHAGEDSCILVLDQVQDPQNLGAVLRTAAATGVDAVVLPKAGGCPLTPAVHKASAGMSLMVPIVENENLARVLDYLKDQGYWVVGCDSEGGEDATLFEFPHKRVMVMGNEAEGMRRLVRESCDYIVRIPMANSVESLNISVAAAVVLYLAKADLARAAMEENHNGAGNGEANLPEAG